MFSNKKALSSMGYAIVLVIILGVIMIISAPMLAGKYKDEKPVSRNTEETAMPEEPEEENPPENSALNNDDRLNRLEERLNSRISDLESRQMQQQSRSTGLTNKYICNMEGTVDADGNVISANGMSPDEIKKSKIVFVCEYRE